MGKKRTPAHVGWFRNTGKMLQTADGVDVPIVVFEHAADEAILSEWSSYFRDHYCTDSELDVLRNGTGKSRGEWLRDIKFPSTAGLGPACRSGDFAEILVADYLQFLMNYWVPRTRYDRKCRDESKKGVDVIGFKCKEIGTESPDDILITCEVKAALQGEDNTTLARAITGALDDRDKRKAESLNAIKQRLLDRGQRRLLPFIGRFQNKTDHPYHEVTGAAAIHSGHTWQEAVVTDADTSLLNPGDKFCLVITGEQLMQLANALYQKACDEA